jgi:hypothetical protein
MLRKSGRFVEREEASFTEGGVSNDVPKPNASNNLSGIVMGYRNFGEERSDIKATGARKCGFVRDTLRASDAASLCNIDGDTASSGFMARQMTRAAKRALQLKAKQAVQIKSDLIVMARNAMSDANAAAQLSMTKPIRTWDEMLAARSKEYSGDCLYKQVIADAAAELQSLRKVTDAGGCFIGGTLVHTKEGLRPIEDIKIGDYVLSRPEDGSGEPEYKRVVRTMRFENKEVWYVEMFSQSEREAAKREGRLLNEDTFSYFVVTPNHPFWGRGVGWTRADELNHPEFFPIEWANGETGLVSYAMALYATVDSNVVWVSPMGISSGDRVDLSQGGGSIEKTGGVHGTAGMGVLDEHFRCTVYNLEVEDFHTYYVGMCGAWVHDQFRRLDEPKA